MHRFNLVAAFDRNNAIGTTIRGKSRLPWRLQRDLDRFKNLTEGSTVLMGRRTWDSLPCKPLPDRKNIVLTTKPMDNEDVVFSSDLEWCFDELARDHGYVIGGQDLYDRAPDDPRLDQVHLTRVHRSHPGCDTFFPTKKLTKDKFRVKLASSIEYERDLPYHYEVLERRNTSETAYLDLLRDVLHHGVEKDDRTGTGIKSIFAPNKLEFDLRYNSFPLLTTKKLFFKGIAEELLWFLRGSVNTKELQDRGVHFWDANSTNKFLCNRKLGHFGENTIGKGYGHQIRHWGGEYHIPSKSSGGGIDQVQRLIEGLTRDPNSRRHLISTWNVGDLDEMALLPCHMSPVQFWVNSQTQELSCQWYQRSADLFLGVPFNIASYALMTKLVAKDTGLKPGKLTACLGDAHVYLNHMDQVKEQLWRDPKRFPELIIKQSAENKSLDFKHMRSKNGYTHQDFEIIGYDPYPLIKADMAI